MVKFEDNSDEAKGNMKKANEAAMEAVLLAIESQAKAFARVDSGEMRDKVDHQTSGEGSSITGQVGSPNEHALYNEFGTGEFAENGAGRQGGWTYQDESGEWHHTYGMKPQPFLRPAFRENKDNVKSILGKEYGSRFKGK